MDKYFFFFFNHGFYLVFFFFFFGGGTGEGFVYRRLSCAWINEPFKPWFGFGFVYFGLYILVEVRFSLSLSVFFLRSNGSTIKHLVQYVKYA